jgi:putative ABC transport system permease protein
MRRRGRPALDDLDQDLRDHLAREIEENVARGLAPDEARRQALVTLGNPTLIAEDTRRVWVWRWLDDLGRDLSYALRSLRRAPAFSAVAVLTLGLGVGAITAVSSVVYGVLYRPLPFPNANRLVEVVQLIGRGNDQSRAGLRPEQIAAWRVTSRTLSAIGYNRPMSAALTGVPTPVRLVGASVSTELFRALGGTPTTGRLFTDDEALPGNDRVVVLAHRTWTDRYGADPAIVGAGMTLNDQTYRVIGVMPASFGFPSIAGTVTTDSTGALADDPEFWVPLLAPSNTTISDTGGFSLFTTFALLRPGVTLAQATAEASTLLPMQPSHRQPIELVNARVEQARAVAPILLIFQVAVAFVLFIACANVTNLLLARAAYRQRELAVRLSLGADLFRLVRQALAEGLVVGAAGAVVGGSITYGAVAWFHTLPPSLLPRMREIHVDAATLAFALAVSLAAGAGVSIMAVGWKSRRDVTGFLRGSASAAFTTSRRAPLRALVIAEVAAGMILFTGAALLLSSFARLADIPPGFDPQHVFSFHTSLPSGRDEVAHMAVFRQQLTEELRRLPQVTGTAASNGISGNGLGFDLKIDARPVQVGVVIGVVTADFFKTVGIAIRQGRGLVGADESAQARVVVVNEAFVRRCFPESTDPLGHHLSFQSWNDLEIVGVTTDIHAGRPDDPVRPQFYVPVDARTGAEATTFFVRTAGPATTTAAAVRALVGGVDPSVVVYDAGSLETRIERSYADARTYGVSSATFAGVALILAAIGLYGVLAFTVGARTRELGVRIAIGASVRQLLWMVLRDALGTVVVGIALGLGAAWYLSRFLQKWLYGITPHDPRTLAVAAAVFLAVGALAAYLPARRAMRVDPIVALRID